MNSRLPRLTAVVILVLAAALGTSQWRKRPEIASEPPEVIAPKPASAGQFQPQPPPDLPSAGDRLLMQAITRLESRSSVSARLQHQVAADDSPLLSGSYCQQGSGESLRVRLDLQLIGQNASLLQVCNSRFLWIDRRMPTGRFVSRFDLRQLRNDPVVGLESLSDIAPGSATWSAIDPAARNSFGGGLPGLLASLRESFSFLPPQAMRLAVAPAAATQPANIPVFAVVGHWKPQKLAALVGNNQPSNAQDRGDALDAQLSMLHSLPARLPAEVLLLVGQGDLFPYRLEYRRLETPVAATHDSPSTPYQLSANPLVVLELTEVAFDVPIAAGQFDYAPGDADWSDQTAALVERLRQRTTR